ncbi:hypothetical protein VFPPC_13038 [Pochonia chlamydosporia 170]|uniref:Uncharacterized protein n=1 Tax=Pochonia chlamydosporia 170 TaxID=1380566 RepID=A0A179G854_METCM|nr:hypothetical protein VFPPC_13038 [Pochonia chlamydosporia 170]OAQ73611.1 hypothetical protein VFPPC_13038 [Pochonia chlamydosporia 170]
MKFIYIIALLTPAIFAAKQSMEAEDIAKVDALEQLIKKSCPELSPQCLAIAQNLLNRAKKNGAGLHGAAGAAAMKYTENIAANLNCVQGLKACAKKIAPAFAAAHGPAHPM